MEGLSAELIADLAIDANSIIFIVVIVNLLLDGGANVNKPARKVRDFSIADR